MRILFLHGWQSVVGGRKPSFLIDLGHEVANPALDHNDFDRALATSQSTFDRFEPQVIVGSSRGAALAMNLDAGNTPLVLLCPAWKKWGRATNVPLSTYVLHSRQDEVIPYHDSDELVTSSRLRPEQFVTTGKDHRLADPESLNAMLKACESSSV
ncbi:MAG: alpha/beta fold hydrolase [Rubripirellula sp.]